MELRPTPASCADPKTKNPSGKRRASATSVSFWMMTRNEVSGSLAGTGLRDLVGAVEGAHGECGSAGHEKEEDRHTHHTLCHDEPPIGLS